MTNFLVSFLLFLSAISYAYEHDLAIGAIFQNEAPYLKEWIEYHKLIGVEKFYLYNNSSTDGYLEVLEPYVDSKEVTLIPWPYPFVGAEQWNAVQYIAYDDCLNRTRNVVKWLAIIDVDEFICLDQEDSLVHFLKDYENVGGLCVNWKMFGTSGIQKIPENQLLIETLTQCAEQNHPEHLTVKSIVRPECTHHCINPHWVWYQPGWWQVNADHVPFSEAFSPYVSDKKISINHYWLRDLDYMENKKLPRLRKTNPLVTLDFLKYLDVQYSKSVDKSILRFVPALRAANY